ncbi:hypothetical protein [Flagellimonas pacifica]|uniref:DUF308 domain-containing protein n=1 Tax=Flagellimonas pacifica TaxID=1247520 RepID=A0A285MVN1_9FLAO|nr:hypothetical protein [Allomuricauda parva]SNZ01168.1 hypothetical protein SAMN06265377_3001 [Allomuricauda parva]
MKKLGHLNLVGLCLIVVGITIMTSKSLGVDFAKIVVPLLFVLSGIFSITYSRANKEVEVISKFQLIKGIGLLAFAGLLSFLSDGLTGFLMYTAYFTLMYGLLEITFPFAVLNSKNKVVKIMLGYRIIAGFAIAIGAVVLLFTTILNDDEGLITAGALTLFIGLSNLIYAAKLKGSNSEQ